MTEKSFRLYGYHWVVLAVFILYNLIAHAFLVNLSKPYLYPDVLFRLYGFFMFVFFAPLPGCNFRLITTSVVNLNSAKVTTSLLERAMGKKTKSGVL